MVQKVINFGAEPLGIGGDTFGSGFEKCNSNFTELYAKNVSNPIHSNITTYKDVASYYKASSNTGALVIHLPAKFWKSTTLLRMRLVGYNFTNNYGGWTIDLGGQPAATKWTNISATIQGVCPSAGNVQFAWAVDHAVIIIGTATTTWNYPHFAIERLQASYANIAGWETGIWMEIEPDISVYTNLVGATVYGHYRVQNAEKLLTARKINGVAFDGSKDITVADSTKLPLTGGTMAGAVTFNNTTTNDMRVAITSPDSTQSQFHVANGLISGMLQASSGGNLGIYSGTHSKWVVKTDKDGVTQLYGNAETATKWATERKINGVSVDGSKDVTAQITAPNIIGSNDAFTIDTKGYVAGTTGVRLYMNDINFNIYSGLNQVNVINVNADTKTVYINGALQVNGKLTVPKGQVLANIGSAETDAIQTRGIQGSNEAGSAIGDLYLQRTGEGKVYFGGTDHHIDAGTYTGKAATAGKADSATKLATARNVQGVPFDGTKDITLPTFTTTAGLVPPRVGTTTTKYLREDGTWVVPTNTTYAAMSQAEAETGTATSARSLTAAVLKAAVVKHAPLGGQFLGTATNKAIAYNAQTIAENITIPATYNGLSAGPITINDGFTVTIADGATWTIV